MTREEEFMDSLYEEANEQLKEVYKEQKMNRDRLLQEIALVLLTYSILDGLMSLTNNDKTKEYKRLSMLVISATKGQGAIQEKVLTNILNNTVKKSYDFYNYNAKQKDVKKVIDKSFKGKHFSKRVWENEQEVAKKLHKEIDRFLNGKINVNQIKKDIEKTYNANAYNAKRLVETEINRCSNEAFIRFCEETGVKKLRYNATLDNRTCDDCKQYHDNVYDFGKEIELPRHPLCRCFYTIEDDIKDKDEFLNEKKGNDIDSQVNWELVDSDDYKDKFKGIGKNSDVDNEIYNISKRILKHRDGTKFEDLYIVDLNTGKTITYITQDTEMGIRKTDKLERILNRNNKDYVIIHNHPHSGNFSDTDLNTLFNSNSISKIIAAGHDGTLYTINSKKLEINIANELNVYYTKIKKQGYSSLTAEEIAFNMISDKYGLNYERR